MPGSPIVSVGMPVRNGDACFDETIDAIRKQTYKNIELIICDNASTDSTQDVCLRHQRSDARIRYCRHSSNIGMFPNWRTCVELASGEYFMWACYDNGWNRDCIEHMLDRLKRQPHCDLAVPTAVFYKGDQLLLTQQAPPDAVTADRMRVFKYLCRHHRADWLHGLFRLEAVRPLADKLAQLHPWGGDMLCLQEFVTRHDVCSAPKAVVSHVRRYDAAPYVPNGFAEAFVHILRYIGSSLSICVHDTPRGKSQLDRIRYSLKDVMDCHIAPSEALWGASRLPMVYAAAMLAGLAVSRCLGSQLRFEDNVDYGRADREIQASTMTISNKADAA